MTTLTGTTKQIEWAERIRAAAMPALDALRAMVVAAAERDPEMAAKIATTIDSIVDQADASWWIERRALLDGERTIRANVSRAVSTGRPL